MYIFTTRLYEKKIKKLSKKVNDKVNDRLELFLENTRHPLLNDHQLSGVRKSQRSIDITGDYRLIYEQLNNDAIRLIDVDTHHNLYGG